MNVKPNPDKSCVEFQNWLLEGQLQSLSAADARKLTEHLQSCRACSSLQAALSGLQSIMAAEAETGIQPDPEIQARLLAQLARRRPIKNNFLNASVQFVKNLLGYRIPVYQVILTGAVIIIFYLGFHSYSGISQKETIRIKSPYPVSHLLQVPDLEQMQQLSRQNLGISVQEDSMRLRYITVSM